MKKWAACALGLVAIVERSVGISPVIYWATIPTLANETLLVAGAGFGSEDNGTRVSLCQGSHGCSCTAAGPVDADVWTQSVQTVLPENLRLPALLCVTTPGSGEVSLQINAPDIQWITSANPSQMLNNSLQVDPKHPSWINTSVVAGDNLRVFGRGLAWAPNNANCISGDQAPSRVVSTTLSIAGISVASHAANCYEAAFSTNGVPVGQHIATVSTPWGISKGVGVLVLPKTTVPTPVTINVDTDFGGNIRMALTHAASLSVTERKVVVLGATTYALSSTLIVPPNTTLRGADALSTSVVVTAKLPNEKGTCGSLSHVDFYNRDCNPATESCFHDVQEFDNVSSSTDDCCARCLANPSCNGFTHEYDSRRGYLCLLKSCGTVTAWQQDCETTNITGPQTESAYVTRPPPVGTDAITVSSDVELLDFSLTISEATNIAQFSAIFMPSGVQRLKVSGVTIHMLQQNVSNAFKIWGSQFEITQSEAHQSGECLWPNYGPKSDSTPFQPSTLMYMLAAADGWVHSNTFFWRCAFMDLDVSDRVVMENNTIVLTEPGVPPHGNSISGYNTRLHPSNRFWSYARNTMVRPPSSYNDRQIWTQRETVTTDGTGYLTSGFVDSITPNGGLVLSENMSEAIGKVGDKVLVNGLALYTLRVTGGSGVGQSRFVTDWSPATRTLTLESPLDAHFTIASPIAVLGSFGQKAIVGNVFNWTEVVQWYSNTLWGVMADNTMSDCNVLNGGNVGNASMGARGECYNGPGTVWFTEFTNNTQVRSDGIALGDAFHSPGGVNQNDCPVFNGPYIRWSVARRNHISGISAAQRPYGNCGSVSNSDLRSTDLMSEHNTVDCPSHGKIVNAAGSALWPNISCSHCITRN